MSPPRPATSRGAVRVPLVGGRFWLLKGLSTALGEAASDYLVHRLGPVPAVLFGFVAFLAALTLQLRRRRYVTWNYWMAVVGVGVFGTMAADVLHVGLHVPYVFSLSFFAAMLACVFVLWGTSEGTLSIHAIDSTRREVFYWAAVISTFALGTAAGDFSAVSLHLGYLTSAAAFAAAIATIAFSYRIFALHAVVAFWTAYVLTRPLGASIADGLGKPTAAGGLGAGSGTVAVAFGAITLVVIAWSAHLEKRPSQPERNAAAPS